MMLEFPRRLAARISRRFSLTLGVPLLLNAFLAMELTSFLLKGCDDLKKAQLSSSQHT